MQGVRGASEYGVSSSEGDLNLTHFRIHGGAGCSLSVVLVSSEAPVPWQNNSPLPQSMLQGQVCPTTGSWSMLYNLENNQKFLNRSSINFTM